MLVLCAENAAAAMPFFCPKTLNSKYLAQWRGAARRNMRPVKEQHMYSNIDRETAPIIRGWRIQDGSKTAQGVCLEAILTWEQQYRIQILMKSFF